MAGGGARRPGAGPGTCGGAAGRIWRWRPIQRCGDGRHAVLYQLSQVQKAKAKRAKRAESPPPDSEHRPLPGRRDDDPDDTEGPDTWPSENGTKAFSRLRKVVGNTLHSGVQ